LRTRAADAAWQLRDGDLVLDFTLPPGSYATVLLSELADPGETTGG
ncbi:MAG: tRNA pseudouridine(13) synthase TruD, partial [Myxococcales bacterium]|nr:tRNA pseudouridine(13) synthase TruD [Myxococcales bacterium]